MTALTPVEPSAVRTANPGGEPLVFAPDLFTDLLGSMGNSAVASTEGRAAEIGRQGAPAAPGKRSKKPGGSSSIAASPTNLAVAELSSRGTPKATVEAAERDSKAPTTRQNNQPPSKGRRTVTDSARETSESSAGRTAPQDVARARSAGASASRDNAPTATEHSPKSMNAVASGTAKAARAAALVSTPSPALFRSLQGTGPVVPQRAQSAPQVPILRAAVAPQGAVRSEAKAAAKQPLPQPTRESEADFASQLGRGFAAILRQSGGSLTLHLQPEALGDLTIRMDLQPGKVAATFEVESDQAQQLLHANMSALRSALEARGLGVDSLTVHVSPPAQDAPALIPTELGSGFGGAGNPEGGASGGGGSGTDRPHAHAANAVTRSVESEVPEAGATGVDAGGAQVVRLSLDAVA